MNKPWKLILLLVAIFSAGGVAGWFLALKVNREPVAKRTRPEDWAPQQMKRLAEKLQLNPEQTEEVKAIVRRNSEELNRLRNYSFAETKIVFERMEREIAEKLTPEQRTKFEQLNKEQRERVKKFMPERANRNGQPSGPRLERAPGDPIKGPDDRPPPEKPPGT
jgi:uncharacterized membrane protein